MKFTVWLILSLFFLFCGVFSYELGWIEYIWEIDVSKISFLIFSIFILSFGNLGWGIWKYDCVFDEEIELGYEVSDWLMGLGLLGTVIGLIYMSTSLIGVDLSNIKNVQKMFTLVVNGISTSLYTTAFGVGTSLILRVYYFLLERR